MPLPAAVAGCLSNPLCAAATAVAVERGSEAILNKMQPEKRERNLDDARTISRAVRDWTV